LRDVWSILVLANYSAALDRRHCISILVLSASDICGDLPPEVDGTVWAGDTILHIKRQQSDPLWRLHLVAREKDGHGDTSRFSWRFPDKGSQGVSSLVCANVFPTFFDLPISTKWFIFVENLFF
jgi:hypothetical protein